MSREECVSEICHAYTRCADGCPFREVKSYKIIHYCDSGYESVQDEILSRLGYMYDGLQPGNEIDIMEIFQ